VYNLYGVCSIYTCAPAHSGGLSLGETPPRAHTRNVALTPWDDAIAKVLGRRTPQQIAEVAGVGVLERARSQVRALALHEVEDPRCILDPLHTCVGKIARNGSWLSERGCPTHLHDVFGQVVAIADGVAQEHIVALVHDAACDPTGHTIAEEQLVGVLALRHVVLS
jgi:hypothetical protein